MYQLVKVSIKEEFNMSISVIFGSIVMILGFLAHLINKKNGNETGKKTTQTDLFFSAGYKALPYNVHHKHK
jgi:hypothetical protein